MNDKKISLTAQNRLIISGLLLSTVLIIIIAIFSIFNIQNKLDEGYQSFGKIISKALAVECAELSRKMSNTESLNTVKAHADTILSGHSDILYIKITDEFGNEVYNHKGDAVDSSKRNVTVNSQITSLSTGEVLGNVTVAFSGVGIEKIFATTRASMIFVFLVAWIVFAFVVLINTYLITRELRILKEGVGKISSGEFGYTIVGKDVSEEVEELFNSFNNMSAKLHVYEEQNIEQLTLERNKLEAVLLSIANGVVVCDYDDNVVLLNRHAKMLLEVEDENFLNTKIQDYSDTVGNLCFKDKIEQYKSAAKEELSTSQIEFNIKIDERTIKSIISPMFTRNNDYVGYIIVLIDMTKEAEMDLMRANFISNVSHEVEVSVKDEGCGIAPEYQKKVFDRFFRVENNTHTIKGTGLGLNLVKTTIERYHQGEVFVNSKVGEGSTFGFRLPYEG
jgi:two-component system sensor histidine kinase NblS